MDAIDEQLDTLGKAFLGMTFGCARCHDHKFDPILQTDYYSLAAIFKSTATFADENFGSIKYWYEHPIGTEEENERIAAIDKELKALKSAASSFRSKAIVRLRGQARSKATAYLVACLEFEPGASLREVEAVAGPLGLHPRVLHHCRMHLNFHRKDPFFADWHRFAEAGDTKGLPPLLGSPGGGPGSLRRRPEERPEGKSTAGCPPGSCTGRIVQPFRIPSRAHG